MDAMYFTLTPETKDFAKSFKERGFELREPLEHEPVRIQKGYKPENARLLDFEISENKTFTLTVQIRTEKDGNQTAFIAVSGEQLDYVPYEDIIRKCKDWVKGTRADVACDIEYETKKEMRAAQLHLCKLVGFDPVADGYEQNPDNEIIGGRRNTTKPIRKASLIASNGLTLYIGGRQSKMMIRTYDKSAEVKAKTGKDIEPTLRIELEVKQELANGVARDIAKSNDAGHALAHTYWTTLSDDHISFESGTLSEVMDIDSAEIIEIDYSKRQGVKLEYDHWVRRQVAPKFRELYGHLKTAEQMEKLWDIFMGEDIE